MHPPRSFPPSLREIADAFFTVIFPSFCSLCHQELRQASTIDICRDCWNGLEPWSGPVCAQCGLPFASERTAESNDARCFQCREGAFHFDLARSFGVYTGKLRATILQLKFRRRERLGKRLGKLLAPAWTSLVSSCAAPHFLVPVPLHSSRRRQRGFNQAELLARGLRNELAESFQIQAPQLRTDCLRRTQVTAPQTGLSFHQRQENVRGVFAVPKPELIRGRILVLVDDVMTTGATLSACAQALKMAGAAQVLGLTLARATPQAPDLDGAEAAQTVDDLGHEWL